MKIPTSEIQIINQGGKPAFAVVPYEQWLALTEQEDEAVYIPHEVVGIQLMQQCSLITAWRKYRKITQIELAEKTGITQAALSQIENPDSKPQRRTLEKIAGSLGLSVEQLIE
jgi:DNA-binding XRE family transcriptional regulator